MDNPDTAARGLVSVRDMTDLITDPDGLVRPSWAMKSDLARHYYDTEWGEPVVTEQGVFERISLEVFQAGLSWETVLRKRPAFRQAFADFDPDVVATFGDEDRERLLADAAIIRNAAKIDATIGNAAATIALRDEGGLAALVWSYRPDRTPLPAAMADVASRSPESIALARDLKRRGFSFVGPTTAYAMMSAIGIVDAALVGASGRNRSGLWNPDGTKARDVELPRR